jgi:hypothetical protein
MIYFAHGANIDRPQMMVRCPHARFLSPARLRDYRLCFPRWSKIRESAVAGIEPAKGELVWGVAYELTHDDLARMDIVEGYAPGRDPGLNAANRVPVRIERTDGLSHDAETHVPVAMAEPGQPSPAHLMVLLRAAMQLEFPAEFTARFKPSEDEPIAA